MTTMTASRNGIYLRKSHHSVFPEEKKQKTLIISFRLGGLAPAKRIEREIKRESNGTEKEFPWRAFGTSSVASS
jgi:hypothetical protein